MYTEGAVADDAADFLETVFTRVISLARATRVEAGANDGEDYGVEFLGVVGRERAIDENATRIHLLGLGRPNLLDGAANLSSREMVGAIGQLQDLHAVMGDADDRAAARGSELAGLGVSLDGDELIHRQN